MASSNSHLDPNILEELLETSRNTQRLLGNTDSKLYGNIDQVNKKVDDVFEKIDKHYSLEIRRSSRKMTDDYRRSDVFGTRENRYVSIQYFNCFVSI